MQCSNGHTLCSGCKPRVHNRCPTCRHELGNIRCLALEKVAASLELPCKYQSFGCIGIYPYYCKLKHEAQCVYRPYNCPYAGSECTVVGDITYLVAHLKDDHKVDMHNGSTFNHRYVKSNPHEVENATWMLTVSFLSLTNVLVLMIFFSCVRFLLSLCISSMTLVYSFQTMIPAGVPSFRGQCCPDQYIGLYTTMEHLWYHRASILTL